MPEAPAPKPVSVRRRDGSGEPGRARNPPCAASPAKAARTSSRGATRWRGPISWRKGRCASTTRARTGAKVRFIGSSRGSPAFWRSIAPSRGSPIPPGSRATAPTRFTIVPGDVYRKLFATDPAVQRFTFEALSGRLFELMALIEETASQGLEARVAAFLLRRAKGEERVDTHAGAARAASDDLARGRLAGAARALGAGARKLGPRPDRHFGQRRPAPYRRIRPGRQAQTRSTTSCSI